MPDLLEQLAELHATEKRVAMATLMAARGGSPRPVGAKLFVGEGGRLLGSVSIGLDIGGREPEEIAVSIIAQIIAVREGKPVARRAESR